MIVLDEKHQPTITVDSPPHPPPAYTSDSTDSRSEKLLTVDDRRKLLPALPPRPSSSTLRTSLSPSPSPSSINDDDNNDEHSPFDQGTTEPIPSSSSIPLPESTHPTVVLAIPFPALLHNPPSDLTKKEKKKHDAIPPFVLYAPLAAALTKPAEGEKEGVVHKARRKWEEEEREAKEGGAGFKAKAVTLISKGMSATKNSRIEFLIRTPNKKKLKELHIIYPASYAAEHIKELFTDLIKKAKSGAIRNGIISTALLPFVLAFDVLTFVTGPFEINAVWAASSWTGAARASALSSRLTSSSLPVHLSPSPQLDILAHRLHELAFRKLKHPRSTIAPPRWAGEGVVRRGPDLGGVVLGVLEAGGQDMAEVERGRAVVGEDLERCLRKGVREWVKAVDSA